MFRRIGCESVAFAVPVSASEAILDRYDLINEMRDSSVRIAFKRVLRLAITATHVNNNATWGGTRQRTFFFLGRINNSLSRRLLGVFLLDLGQRASCSGGPRHRIHADHLSLPGLDKIRDLAEANVERLLLTVNLHRLAVLRRMFAFVDTLVHGQWELGAVRRCPVHLRWVECEKHGGLVVVLQDLAVDGEVVGVRAGRRRSRPPADQVERWGLVDVLDCGSLSLVVKVSRG